MAIAGTAQKSSPLLEQSCSVEAVEVNFDPGSAKCYDPADSFGRLQLSSVNMQDSIMDTSQSYTLLHSTERGIVTQVRYIYVLAA